MRPDPAATHSAPSDPDDTTRTPGDPAPADAPPVAADRYELLDEIARGGMGAVYRATDHVLGREVAVKVLRGSDLPGSAADRRFRDEARIAGQLQHPGIPPVHDLGTLPDGRPFLAMKLIKGRTLDELLKARGGEPNGAPGELLAVFEQVCQAVAYAHAHRVVHRDLKPANVMVGAFGEVQVMDWGLAKVLASGGAGPRHPAADPDATIGTEIRSLRDSDGSETQAGSLLGTPAYMPPEQAMGAVDEIDTRSDVFGLGALLCVILTGRPPYVGPDAEAVRKLAVRGRLDDAFARLAACGAEPDLVALCRRCLSPEKADRPADAGEVAAAVAGLRAAADERARRAEVDRERAAVRAGEERKRRRVLAWSAAAVALVLAAGAGAAAWQAVRATDAERATAAQLALTREAVGRAVERERQEKAARASAEAVAGFMREVFAGEGTHGAAGRNRDAARKRTVMEAMGRAAKTIAGRFGDRPEVEAAVRETIGLTYQDLGAYAEARPQFEQALALREAALGPDHPATLGNVGSLGRLYEEIGDYPAAEPLLRRALTGYEAVVGPDHPNTLAAADNLANLLTEKGELEAAEVLHRRALASTERTVGPDHPDTLSAANNLAGLLEKKGDSVAAEALYRRALTGREKALGPTHAETLATVNNLANLLLAKGDLTAAETLQRRALAGLEKALGPDHPQTLNSANNLAALLFEKRDYAAAEPLYRRALAGWEKVLPPDHPNALNCAGNLGLLYFVTGRYADAVPLLDRTARGFARRPELARFVPAIRAELGRALLRAGKPAEAEPHLLAGFGGLAGKTLDAEDLDRLRGAAAGLAELYERADQPGKAKEWRAKLATLPREFAPPPRPAK